MVFLKQTLLPRCLEVWKPLAAAKLAEHAGFNLCGKPLIIRLFCLKLLIFISAFFNMHAATADDTSVDASAATIDFSRGTVTVFPKNDKVAALTARRSMTITKQDRIITGDDGFASLSLSNGTVISIQPFSDVIFDELSCQPNASRCRVELNVRKGAINSNVKNLSGGKIEFKINTPYASAAVRGTIFDIDVGSNRFLAGVTEGHVVVNAASAEVQLPENYGVKVEADKPPSQLAQLLSAPMFSPSSTRYNQKSKLTWAQVALATEYLVSLNNELGLVYREQSTDPVHRLSQLDVGSYALRIRAIDDEGFKGNVAERAIDVVRTDQSRAGPPINVNLDDNQFAVSVKEVSRIGNQVEFQFSTTRDFAILSSMDSALGKAVSADLANNSIYVRARGIVSKTIVTPFGPVTEIPSK